MKSQAPHLPLVSIIVPVRNAGRTIHKTLQYLEALDYPKDRLEIIIADGDSVDGTLDTIRSWQERCAYIKLVQVPHCKSPGHARNAALKIASGEFVLFTDGDCAPNPDWVHNLIRPFSRDPLIAGVGGEVLTLRTESDNLTESYCEQTGFLSVTGRCGITEEGYLPGLTSDAPHEVNGGNHSPFFATANVAFRRSVIDQIGGEFWDEPTGEDVDLCIRILRKGYKLYFAKSALVRHMHRVSLDSFLKQWYGYGFGHPLLIAKHAADEIEIFIQLAKPISIRIPFPIKGIVHIGAFHLMHLALAATIASGLAAVLANAFWPLFVVSAAALIILASIYFVPCLKLQPTKAFLTWCKIRYLSNWAFIKGALDGCRKFGAICIEPSW